MLIGQYASKLTDKNRISVPRKFRNELGKSLIVARWYENCLVLVSDEYWEGFLQRLSGISGSITSPVRKVDRFILGSAYEVKLDNQGRFVVPDTLLDYAGIKGEVVFIGLRDRIEIWANESWKEIEATIQKEASEAIERIAKEKK